MGEKARTLCTIEPITREIREFNFEKSESKKFPTFLLLNKMNNYMQDVMVIYNNKHYKSEMIAQTCIKRRLNI